jgi:hypothetical protein
VTRDAIAATARTILRHARVAQLRELAAQTSAAFDELRQHGVPVDVIVADFSCEMFRQRVDEQVKRAEKAIFHAGKIGPAPGRLKG